MTEEQINVGGQAVIEGVMMRSPRAMAVAVRRASGELVVREEPWVPIWSPALTQIPVLRGALVLVESVLNGFNALSFAAEEADLDAERARTTMGGTATFGVLGGLLRGLGAHTARLFASLLVSTTGPSSNGRRDRPGQAGTLALSLVFALGLFVGLPHLLAWLVGWLTGGGWGVDSFAFHLLDGIFKLGIFVGYISLIARIPEIRRVFEYHGAEHKVVNTYERGRPLDMDEVRLQGTFHARCGTSFILFVLVLSIFAFAVILPFVPPVSSNPLLNHLGMILIKVPLMAPLAGLAYEVNRWAARNPGTAGVALLVLPGRWMQRLTVREPDDNQLEVALAALKVALHAETQYSAQEVASLGRTWGRAAGPKVTVHESLEALEASLLEPAS